LKTDGGMRPELALILAACSALQFINPVFGVTAAVVLAAIAALVIVRNSAFGRRFRFRLLAVRRLPSRLCRRWRDKEPRLRWPARLTPRDTRLSTFINSCIAARLFRTITRLDDRGVRKAEIAVVDLRFLKARGIKPQQAEERQTRRNRKAKEGEEPMSIFKAPKNGEFNSSHSRLRWLNTIAVEWCHLR
jgi:hypothetical protein